MHQQFGVYIKTDAEFCETYSELLEMAIARCSLLSLRLCAACSGTSRGSHPCGQAEGVQASTSVPFFFSTDEPSVSDWRSAVVVCIAHR